MNKLLLCALVGVLVFSTIGGHRYIKDSSELKTVMTDLTEETESEIEAPDIRIEKESTSMKYQGLSADLSQLFRFSEKIGLCLSREVLIPPPKG